MNMKKRAQIAKGLILLLVGGIIGFYPVLKYGQPRSSESWSHLENLKAIPDPLSALNFPRMIELFDYKQHYAKYPLFYFLAKAVSVDSPWEAAVFSAVVFSTLPLLSFLVARNQLDDLESMVVGLVIAITPAFVYTTNFFSGGEPLALALFLLGLYLHLERRSLLALPVFVSVVFLHPVTAVFLWLFLLVFPLLDGEQVDTGKNLMFTGTYSAIFLAWVMAQISWGLPLGSYVTSSISPSIMVLAFISITLLGVLPLLLMGRGQSRIIPKIRKASEVLGANLPRIIVIMELALLIVFLSFGIPGTEKELEPVHLVFYSPLLLAIALPLANGKRVPPFTLALAGCFLLLLASGLTITPRGVPVYRLAPYGALTLAFLIAPLVRARRLRWSLPILLAGLAATTYPGPEFYFGFDEQYYPAEIDAVSSLEEFSLNGEILTDTRMEDLVGFKTGKPVTAHGGQPVIMEVNDLALTTRNMMVHGLYPPGSQWYRRPFRLDLSKLESDSLRIYDNGWSRINIAAGSEIPLRVE